MMYKMLIKLKYEYIEKLASYLKMAAMYEDTDKEKFREMIKKASGCTLMIAEYDRQIYNLK